MDGAGRIGEASLSGHDDRVHEAVMDTIGHGGGGEGDERRGTESGGGLVG